MGVNVIKTIKSVAINILNLIVLGFLVFILLLIGFERFNFFIFIIGGVLYYFYNIFSNALVPQMYKNDYLLRSICPIVLTVIFHFLTAIIQVSKNITGFGLFFFMYFVSIGMLITSSIAFLLFIVFNRGSDTYFDE